MSFPFPTATIPELPNNATPPTTSLLEISNAGVSENTSISQMLNTAGVELQTNKGAVSGYAGLDASQELLIDNFPSGTALQLLRRNAANTALEFVDPPQVSPLTTKGDLYTYDTDNQRLPVGSDGQILSANSAQATGLEWIAAPITGITSINADTTAAQILAGTTNRITVNDAGATHTFDIGTDVVTLSDTQTLLNKTIDDATNTITGVFGITGLATQVQILNMGNFTIQAVDTPVNGTDAANKTYVDNLVNGLSWKQPALLATTGDITLSGNQTIDGTLTVDNDRVLVKDQSDDTENGVYAANSGAWTRTEDTDSGAELVNMSIYITKGTMNEDTSWVQTTDPPITIGVTSIVYAQVGAGTGNPLTTKGDIFGYDTANARIPVGTDNQVLMADSAESLGVKYALVNNVNVASGTFSNITGLGVQTQDLDMGIGGIIFSADTPGISGALKYIANEFGTLWFNVESGGQMDFAINNSSIMTLDAGGIDLSFLNVDTVKAITFGGSAVGEAASARYIQYDNADSTMHHNVSLNSATFFYTFEYGQVVHQTFGIDKIILDGQDNDLFLDLNANHVSPSTKDVAVIRFIDNNSLGVGNPVNYGQISLFVEDDTAGSEEGVFTFFGMTGGNPDSWLSYNDNADDKIHVQKNMIMEFVGIDMNGGEIDNLNVVYFDDGAQEMFISNSGNMRLQTPSGNTFDFRVDFSTEYQFDATEANFNGNDLVEVFDVTLQSGGKLTVNSDAIEAGFRDIGHTGDPSSPAAGDFYYNTTSNLYRFYDGTIWANIGGVGGAQTPWTSDIDADGFDLTDLSNIQFRATTGAPAAGNQAIYNNADIAMTFNVPTADVFRWSIQGALGMQLNNLTLNLQNTTSLSQVNGITTQGIITLNTTGGGYISMNAIASPGNSGLATRGSIFMDSGNSNHLTIRRNDGIDVDLEAGGAAEVFTWTADHSAARFNLENTGAIDFHLSGPLVTPAATQPYIMYDTVPTPDGMKINVPGAREIALTFANVREYDFTTTVLDVHGNQIDNVSIFTSNAGTPATTGAIRLGASEEITWKGTGNNSIFFNGSNVFTIEITNGNDYTFSETLFDVNGNSIDNVKDITVDENIILGNAGTLPAGGTASHWWDGSAYMGFNVPNADEYRFYINAGEEYSFSASTADFFNNSLINATITGAANTISGISEAMQTVAVGAAGTVLTSNGVGVAPTYQAGGGGDVTGPGSAVDNELVRFNAATGKIIQGTTIPVVMTDAGEPTWPRAILFANFNTGLPAATEVYIQRYFGSMRLGAPTGEGIDIYINAAAEYIFSSTNLNFNRNDADQLGAVIFNTAGAITGGLATDPYLEYISATHLQLNVPSGDEFNISVNDVEEYSFSSSIFEGNGNIIRNFTSLEIKSITGSGIVRIENTDSTPAAAQTVGTLQFRADRTASSPAEYATIQSVIVDPSAASADGELIFSVIQANNLTEYITLNEGGSTGIHFKRPVQDFLMDLTTGTSSIGNLEGLLFNDDTTQLSANSYIQRSNAHLVINSPTGEDIELGINDLPEMTIALNQITINPATNLLAGGDIVISDRLQANKGPDVTGATTITVGDGNYFDITGSGTINHMTFTGWQNGSMVTLQFDAAGTVNHNTGTNPANTVSFFLAGSVNQTWTAGSTLTVVYDGVVWREVARSLA